MAHELTSAGYGYIWPRLLFASDGYNIKIWSALSGSGSIEPIQYLTNAYASVNPKDFESELDGFMTAVLARLSARGIATTTLHDLWQEVLDERNSTELKSQRRLEAMLGFDPDECDDDTLKNFADFILRAGKSAVDEMLPVCAGPRPTQVLDSILSIANSRGVVGKIDSSLGVTAKAVDFVDSSASPVWEQGRILATEVRKTLGLNGDKISDKSLCEILGLPSATLADSNSFSGRKPLGFAVRSERPDELSFFLRKPYRTARRFELARFLCDSLANATDDRWLPVTDGTTARQKVQRAFAAEFLCPIDEIIGRTGGDFSDDSINDVAVHFGVSEMAITTQLVNHGHLPSVVLNDGDYGWGFPYSTSSQMASF
jgi:hypothetical protein